MPTTTPARIAHNATRICAAASSATLMLVAGWGLQVWTARPHLTLMVFGVLLAVSMVSGVAAVMARCHVSIARAFAAGAQSAQPVQARRSQALRVVD